MPLKPPPSVLSMHGLTTALEKKATSLQPGRTPGPASAAPVLRGFPTGTPSWQELRVTPSIHGQGWGGQQELRTCQHPARAPRTPWQEGAQSWSSTPGDSPRRDRVSWRYSLPKENRAGQKRKLPPEHEGKKGFEFHFTVPWGQTEDFLVAE